MKPHTPTTQRRIRAMVIGMLLVGILLQSAHAQFRITYYDNYNYLTEKWDDWSAENIDHLSFWNYEYLADFTSGRTEPSVHYLSSIDVFDLRTGFASLDVHVPPDSFEHDDWTPLLSIGDDSSWFAEASPHHVYAATFEGTVYFEAGDILSLESDDDAYIFLDDATGWGDEFLSDPGIHPFGEVWTLIPSELSGFRRMTVKFADRHQVQAGIRITLNGEPLEAVLCATVRVEPETLNLDAKGVFTAFIRLSGVYSAAEIDISTVECAGAKAVRGVLADDMLLVSFNCQDLQGLAPGEQVLLTVTGQLIDGRRFLGTDVVRCIGKGSPPANPQTALVGHWKLDERSGATARDSSRNNNHGTLYGDPTWLPDGGVMKGALWLDGFDDYVSLPIGSLIGRLNNCTIMTWAYWDGDHSWQRIFDFGSGTEVNMFLTPMTGEGAGSTVPYVLRFAITTGGGGAEERVSAGPLACGAWYHISVTIDGDNGIITLYLSGTPVAQNAGATLTPSDLGATSQNWLGRSQYPADSHYEGALDDFRIYDRVLSQGEIWTVLTKSD